MEIALTNNRFLKATYLMYGIPFLGLMVGLFVGYGAGIGLGRNEEVFGMIGAVIGVVLGFGFIKWKEKKQAFKQYLPKVVSKK